MKIGPYQISAIETGSFGLDGGAMFGIVPKTIWEKTNPSDEKNRIDLRLRCMLIQKQDDSYGPKRNILVDCGIGLKWAEKYEAIYKIDHSTWSLKTELAKKGLILEDITDVILTHLHFDHAGGLTLKDLEDIVPTFPNAKIYVQKRNWDLAWHPSEKDQASYLSENYSPYLNDSHFKNKIEFIDTKADEPSGVTRFTKPNSLETEIMPGISVEVSHGHTLGMQLIRVRDPEGKSEENIVYCADLIPTSTHVRVPFIMGYDCYPMFILEEKKRLLNRAFDENTALFYEHCPLTHASRVIKNEKGDFQAGQFISL